MGSDSVRIRLQPENGGSSAGGQPFKSRMTDHSHHGDFIITVLVMMF